MGLEGEMRPVDAVREIRGATGELAELAEHIRDTDPTWRREELLDTLIASMDDVHELAVRTEIELED